MGPKENKPGASLGEDGVPSNPGVSAGPGPSANARHWRGLFDASPEMLFIHGPQGEVREVNDRVLQVFGTTRDAIIGSDPYIFSGESEEVARAHAYFEQAALGEAVDFHWVARDSESNEFPVEVRLRRVEPLQTDSSDPHYGELIAVVRDLRELESLAAAQSIEAKLATLSALTGAVAHDFNNALTGLLANLALAHLEASSENQKGFLDLAETSARQAGRLVRKLQSFAGNGEVVARPLHLEPIIKQACTLTERGRHLVIEANFGQDLPPVEADSEQLGLLLHSLIQNAEQAGAKTLYLDLQAVNLTETNAFSLPAGPTLHLELRDDGEGIPEACFDQIFDPYFSTRNKSSGLGLTMARGIATAHHGCLYAEKMPGEGALFNLLLSATDKTVREVLEEDTLLLASGEGRVLVMDDDELILLAAKRILGEAGYEVEIATHGEQALERSKAATLRGAPFQLAILDLVVPGGLGGVRTLQQLREVTPELRAIVSSGYSNDPVLARPKDFGFDEALPKPYRARDLIRIARLATTNKL